MKIGLLPLYVKLYDDKLPELRVRMNAFYEDLAKQFEKRNIKVVRSEFCRLADEFQKTVKHFEAESVDAIVTIHIAYSPSLESIDALCNTELPIVVLDTTETLDFTNMQNPDEIMYCHGVHGVMDMCSMLTRRGKDYAIAAGHYQTSNCIDRVCGYVKAASAAKALKNARVGLVGGIFDGMGDFQVPYSELNTRFGIQVLEQSADDMKRYVMSVTEKDIVTEKECNTENYDLDASIVEDEYTDSIRSCLAVRKCIEEEKLTAFSMNFSNMGEKSGINSAPFLEACKAMERGIGYAGEGDVLTASFVGAFLSSYPETNFVEIFCPDWENDAVFLSHMGEINYRVADIKPCIKRVGVNYSPGNYPYVGYTRMKGGTGIYLNISRGKDDYKLLLSAGEMVDYDNDNFGDSMRGWMKLSTDCATFLEELSQNGATHHSIFIYGASIQELTFFAKLLSLDTIVI